MIQQLEGLWPCTTLQKKQQQQCELNTTEQVRQDKYELDRLEKNRQANRIETPKEQQKKVTKQESGERGEMQSRTKQQQNQQEIV